MSFGITVAFEKADPEGRYVRGWASVVSVDGAAVTDTQGDVIPMDELRKAAHRFVTDARVAKAMHEGSQVGEVVESVIIDDAFAKALGVSTTQRGWWIGMHINDEGIRKAVKAGKLKAFSIGGRGKRQKMEAC
ncbi:Phage-like element PBSX protein, XkdF [uncultured Caudovirales phage]|uniref:Phage-like element PBSX protein, XkdF n=1 Tax=uncultured Caudovirales phage TaxID=2100421 RepID=A0A6J5KLJ9_9CAUD|nr:Phage-like element PBSX protein, XkdF [uncultured Caudovirales phage]CAB4123840.1 Phage-like element PBSX protein, XkdF [uncultured Caudovirales phage]